MLGLSQCHGSDRGVRHPGVPSVPKPLAPNKGAGLLAWVRRLPLLSVYRLQVHVTMYPYALLLQVRVRLCEQVLDSPRIVPCRGAAAPMTCTSTSAHSCWQATPSTITGTCPLAIYGHVAPLHGTIRGSTMASCSTTACHAAHLDTRVFTPRPWCVLPSKSVHDGRSIRHLPSSRTACTDMRTS